MSPRDLRSATEMPAWISGNSMCITQVYGGGYCTYRETERFYSYRRDGATGRMGTFIWLE